MNQRDVRILGAFFALGGTALLYFGKGWYLDGVIPVNWFGVAVAALGAAMAAFPKRFAKA